jgi:hypothetical protein
VNLTFFGVKNYSDLIAGQDIPYQTAPKNHFPRIKGTFIFFVDDDWEFVSVLVLLNSYFPIAI